MNHIIRYALDDFHIDKKLYNMIGLLLWSGAPLDCPVPLGAQVEIK